jgi:hypothetical protein
MNPTARNGNLEVGIIENDGKCTIKIVNHDATRGYEYVIGFNELDDDESLHGSTAPVMWIAANDNTTNTFRKDLVIRSIRVVFVHEPGQTGVGFVREADGQFTAFDTIPIFPVGY